MSRNISRIIEKHDEQLKTPASDGVIFGSCWLFPDNKSMPGMNRLMEDCALGFSDKQYRPIVIIDENPGKFVWIAALTTALRKRNVKCYIECVPGSWEELQPKIDPNTGKELSSYLLFNMKWQVERECFGQGISKSRGICKSDDILRRIKEKWKLNP